jgi:CHAT domain-containing protein/tetratricopeptide (TPR) repeat protein
LSTPFRRLAIGLLLLTPSFTCSTRPSVTLDTIQASAVDALRRGELDRALALADQGIASAGEPASEAGHRLRLLKAEVLLYRREPAKAAALLDVRVPETRPFAGLRARQAYLEGQRHLVEQRIAEAMEALHRASDIARAAGVIDVALDADILRGQALLRAGRWDEAAALLDGAAAAARARGDRYREALALHNRGFGSQVRLRYDEAVPFFERVLALPGLDAFTVHDTALANAAICYARLGEFERALAAHHNAVEGHERRGPSPFLEQALGELGSTYVLTADYMRAIPFLQRALDMARQLKQAQDAALWAGNLASAHLELQQWDEAETHNAAAKALLEGDARNRPYPELFEGRILEGRGHLDEAVRAYQRAASLAADDPHVRWRVEARLGLIADARKQRQLAIRHFERALGIVEQARSGLADTSWRLSIQMRLADLYYTYVDVLVEAGQIERALAVADSGRAAVLAERQGGRATARLEPAAFRRIAARMDSTLLFYSFGGLRSYAWVVTPQAIRLTTLTASPAEIDRLVTAVRREVVDALGDPRAADGSPARRLFDAVVAPVLQQIAPAARVVVIPDGRLGTVNLEALPVAGHASRYWIEDEEIAVAPSLASLQVGADRGGAAGSLLLVGDALPVDEDYPALRYASAEIDAIAAVFPGRTSVLRGRDASPAAFRQADPGKFQMVHFTAHASANAESPLDSAVILSPPSPPADGSRETGPPSPPVGEKAFPSSGRITGTGARSNDDGGAEGPYKLYASDVLALSLSADLVTISACRGAGDRTYAGEGLVGFAWAFLRSGARRVIAGLWDVDDRSTADLMKELYTRLASGQSPSAALRGAKLSLIARNGPIAKPYYWAPFQVFVGAGVVP